jgi:hypothetical protein
MKPVFELWVKVWLARQVAVIVNSNVAHDETVSPISASGSPRATECSIPGFRSVNAATRAGTIMHQPRSQYTLCRLRYVDRSGARKAPRRSTLRTCLSNSALSDRRSARPASGFRGAAVEQQQTQRFTLRVCMNHSPLGSRF